jgi:hypothetical protein
MKLSLSNRIRQRPNGWRLACQLAAALLLTALPVLAAGSPAQDEVTRNFEKSLTLAAGQSVHIEHKFGEVKVHGESGRDVRISATIRAQASSHDEAESFVQKIKIEVEQTSEGVRIKTVYPEEEKSWFHLSKRSSYSVNYDIAMPADAPLYVKNSFGSVTTTGIHAAADVDNSYGSITMHDAGVARLNNSFGSIELTGAAGNSTVNDNNGSVQVSDVKGTLDLRNRFGSITVKRAGSSNLTGAMAPSRCRCGSANVDVPEAWMPGISEEIYPSTTTMAMSTFRQWPEARNHE